MSTDSWQLQVVKRIADDCNVRILSARLNVEHLILACRNEDKGLKALQTIQQEIQPAGKLEVWKVDLAHYSSVVAFGQRISTLPRLDGFIANAGVEVQDFQLCEGIELQLCVNVVSTLLTALAALPKLQATAREFKTQTNLTFQGSYYHIMAPDQELDNIPETTDVFEHLSQPGFDVFGRYSLSKMMLHQCAHELADRVTDVVINITHPGWAATELARSKESISWGQKAAFAMIGWSAEKGGINCVNAVAAGPETHGYFLSEGQIAPQSEFMCGSRNAAIQPRVWEDLMARIGKVAPEIASVVGAGKRG